MPRLREGDLDAFLGLAAWRYAPPEPLGSEGREADPPAPVASGWEREYEEMHGLLSREGDVGLPTDALFVLRKSLEVAAILDRAPVEACAVLARICDGVRQADFVAPFDEREAWAGAIAAARRGLDPGAATRDGLESFSRESNVAHAVASLERQGYRVSVNAFGASLRPASFEAACSAIDAAVARLGGRDVARNVLEGIAREGRIHEGSFLYGRRVQQLMWQPRMPSVPWHYVYNLALKHINAPASSRDPQGDWVQLVELARDVAATLDLETYNTFENMEIAPTGITGRLLEGVLHDELFAFQQWQPKHAVRLLSLWLRCLEEEGCPFPVGTRGDWEAVCGSLLKRAAPAALEVTVAAEHAVGAVDPAVRSAIVAALSARPGRVNEGYRTPGDTGRRTSPYHPLLELAPGLHLLTPRCLAARAVFERLYALMREAAVPALEQRMGAALERLTAEALRATGTEPSIVGGRYVGLDGRGYEADLVVETPERVLLIECHKKALTNLARAGGTLETIADLNAGFLRMLVQLSRQELTLRTRGRIEYEGGKVLELGGREVERVAVTAVDHGSLQDRVFLGSLVRILLGSTLSTDDPALQARLDPTNKQVAALTANVDGLAKLAGGDPGRFIHGHTLGTWWLSVDQLFYLCAEAGDLWAGLRPMRHVTFRSGDMMSELEQLGRKGLLRWRTHA